MNQHKNRILAAGLALMMAFTTAVSCENTVLAREHGDLSGHIHQFATPAGSADEYGRVPVDADIPSIHDEAPAGTIRLRKGNLKSASSLPERYSSYEKGYIPPVRDQQYMNNCWAYGANAAMEASMIRNQIIPCTRDNTDFSELQLTYYFYNRVTDPLGLTAGDRTINISSLSDLTYGGNNLFTSHELMSWQTPHNENTNPKSQDEINNGVEARLSGVSESDPQIDEKIESAIVAETENISYNRNPASVYGSSAVHPQGYYIFNPKTDSLEMKQAVMDFGALSVDYFDAVTKTQDKKYRKGYNYYCSEWNDNSSYSNHTVALIGWDDNYSRENFATDPGADGAWIIRNSWGPGSEDDTSVDENGNMYISYKDKSFLGDNYPIAYRLEKKTNYKYNYQYDGSSNEAGLSDITRYANVFTVKGARPQVISAVGVGVEDVNTSFTIRIYKHVTSTSDPTKGVLVSQATTKAFMPYFGYETIKLKKPVTVNPGEKYTVEIIPSEEKKLYMADRSYTRQTTTFVNKTAAGQSFCLPNGNSGWEDLHPYGISMRIKAYANDYTGSKTSISGKTVTLSRPSVNYNGKTQKPVVKTVGGKACHTSDYSIRIVDKNGKTCTAPKNAGTYTVIVTGKGTYSGTAKVSYRIKPISNTIKVKSKNVTSKGKTFTIKKKTLKKKKMVLSVTRNGSGKITMKNKTSKASKRKYLKLNGNKVTLSKKAKRGTYRFTLTVGANSNWKKTTSKTITIKVK